MGKFLYGCQDDLIGLRSSAMFTLLLQSQDISWEDALPPSQTVYYGYVPDIAKFCPQSLCKYNPLSRACRLSKCCSDSWIKQPQIPVPFNKHNWWCIYRLPHHKQRGAYAHVKYRKMLWQVFSPTCLVPILCCFHIAWYELQRQRLL